ncbi:MAG: nicotinate (nicotinamide) nucleotide adenylyltransferase [Chloroflexi bacterium]|nr:nicotinate (nicotinamide) nucleotide adenylyltransferase [Chloroflexota bacterium]
MERIGILGGTFDPPHLAHLILAEYARDAADLGRVLFVPAGLPPHKQATRTPIEHRLAMLELAIEDRDCFAISRVDIDRPGPHYTVDMIKLLQAEHTQAELYFLMGGDSLRDLPKWNRPEQLITLVRFVVMNRPDLEISATMHQARFPGLAGRVTLLNSPLLLGISSTYISEQIHKGRSARYLVPDAVLAYIRDHKLYQD